MRILLFAFLVIYSFPTVGQDLLITRDGDTIKAIVIFVYPDDLKYRKFENTPTPIITVPKYELSRAIYANGNVDDFTQWKKPKSGTTAKEPLKPLILSYQRSNDSLKYVGDTIMMYNNKQIDFGTAYYITRASGYPVAIDEMRKAEKNRRWKRSVIYGACLAVTSSIILSLNKEEDALWGVSGTYAAATLIVFPILGAAENRRTHRAFDCYNQRQ